MNKAQFLILIDKYLAGKASAAEEQLLYDFFESFQSDQNWNEKELGIKQQLEDKMLQRLQLAIAQSNKTNTAKIKWLYASRNIAAAVVLLMLACGGLYYWLAKPVKQPAIANNKQQVIHDILPGTNKATLTLANGTVVDLNSTKIGVVDKGSAIVKKVKEGQLLYETNHAIQPAQTAYNTIITPRGGQYQVVLPDGSKVYLDAASSLKFPTAFTGNDRTVELTGQAYFEVAKNAAKPFKVKVSNLEVRVLGTHFNIMAYSNEAAIKTTLLEGSVRLTSGAITGILKPGQQGSLNHNGQINIAEVNTDEAVAWKNGYFDFNRANIHTIMNQVSRWYDVDVTYEGKEPDDEFVGKIERNVKLSQLLHILQLSHVHFRVEGKNIVVTP